jgi:hypothetical protein
MNHRHIPHHQLPLIPGENTCRFPGHSQDKKCTHDVSSELHLDIGFDTEYVYNLETQQNDILSYQSYTVLPDGTGVPDIFIQPVPVNAIAYR